MRLRRILYFFLFAAAAWASPQQVALNGNSASVALPNSPYSTLAAWHIDWRVTITLANTTSPAWAGYNQAAWIAGGVSYMPAYWARLYGVSSTGYSYLINDYQDRPSQESSVQFNCPTLNFGQDSVVRVQKFATSMTCETWNVDGSNYQITQNTFPFTAVAGLAGTIQIGNGVSNEGTMAFFRGYTGTVPLQSKVPFGSSGGDLWDYEFNGNLKDSSGHNLALAPTGSFNYSVAATYPPACILPPQSTFRAGTPLTVLTASNSFPLNGNQQLSYLWQQIPSNLTGLIQSNVQFNNQTAVTPTIGGLVAGTYNMQLTVTDSNGQSTTCSTKYGAVATDANGSVIIPNPVHAQILGPLSAVFASPWAAEPQQHIAQGQLLIQKMAGTTNVGTFWFIDYWNQALAGTVSVTNGSNTVTGVGTSFTTQFCQGPANPTVPKNLGSTGIAIWYPILSPGGNYPSFNGGTGRRFGGVSACIDDTHLTANFPSYQTSAWQTSAYVGAGSGLSYGYVETQCGNVGGLPNCVAVWNYNSAPANFYDDVKALYALYYRTGIDDYLVAARTFADRWWSYPSIDKGLTYETSNGNGWGTIVANRQVALTGLYMRNADNPPYDYGPGLRAVVNYMMHWGTPGGSDGSFQTCLAMGPSTPVCGQDVRESGYALGYVAEDYLFNSGPNGVSPNPAQAAVDLAALTRDMNNRWDICQNPAYYPKGVCTQNDYLYDGGLYASWNGAYFPVSVTNGSSTVTASGGTFATSNFAACYPTACSASNPPNAIWITTTGAHAPAYPSQGDGNWYYVVCSTSATCPATTGTLTLTDITGQNPVNYTGATQAGTAGFQTINYGQAQGAAEPGFFWQPYMTGILSQSYAYAGQALATSDPTNAANIPVWTLNNVKNMATLGLNVTTQGLTTNGPWYEVGLICPAGGPGVAYPGADCDSGLLGDRELSGEALNIATIGLQLNPSSPTALTLGDTMMAAIYAQPGEIGFDGTNILSDLVNPGFLYTANSQQKWFGFYWGEGANWSWAATRVGGLRPPNLKVVQVILYLQWASKAVLTLIRPDGSSSEYTCTSSPCPVTIDAREGDHLLSITYLSQSNQVLSTAQQTIIRSF